MHYEGKLKLNNKKLKLTSKQNFIWQLCKIRSDELYNVRFDNCVRYEVMSYTMLVIVVPVV